MWVYRVISFRVGVSAFRWEDPLHKRLMKGSHGETGRYIRALHGWHAVVPEAKKQIVTAHHKA